MLTLVSRIVRGLAVSVVVAGLAACGGGKGDGGSSSSSAASQSTGADATHGALTLDLTGGANRDVNHVWVTVGSVALHAQASQAWSASDSSWTVLPLATPVVVDLAAVATSSNSDMTNVLSGVKVPVGTYAQIRFFLLPHDAALSSVARANGLQYNAQVNYTDAGNVARTVPLELPQTELGWRVAGTFTFAAYSSSHYVAQADTGSGLVRFASLDGIDRFTFKPSLRSYDTGTSGAILGFIDPASLCGGASAPAAPNCAQDVIVSAQRLSGDGLRHESVRRYKVDNSGGFTLYPLPPETSFDLVITGRRMRPMVIKNVSVDLTSSLSLVGWTTVGFYNPGQMIVPQIVPGTTRTVNLSAAVSPTAGSLYWGQTADAAGKPYELLNVALDPFTGLLAQNAELPQGALRVATFATSNAVLGFSDATPIEGADALSVFTQGTAYDTVSSAAIVAPALGVASTVPVNAPTRPGSLGTGVIQVNLTGSLSAAYDVAQLVVSDINGIVATQTVSGNSASFTVPAGTQAAALGGTAVYTVSVRASSHTGAVSWVRAGTALDLRGSAGATVTLALP
ncbi:MAG: DUF4382 domain-containing protein [Aquabacterium sp.]